MIFSWLRERRRRRLLAGDFPPAWQAFIERAVPHYDRLDEAAREDHRRLTRLLLAEKSWEGCGGLVLTDEIRVTIAALAGLPALRLPPDSYDGVTAILVYPDDFDAPPHHAAEGVAGGENEPLSGEAHYRGPLILSWAEIRSDIGGPDNVVIHEFAHALDDLDGAADGTPPLPDRATRDDWRRVMTREFANLRRAERADEETRLDPYGAESPAEFFAIASECFFTRPDELAAEHPGLYGQLSRFYGQDPASHPGASIG